MSNELVHLVANAQRSTQVKAYLQTKENTYAYPVYDAVMMGDIEQVKSFLASGHVLNYELEATSHQSRLGLENPMRYPARIEMGALIRKGVEIENDAVILMGAVLNTQAKIGTQTMIDMNAVIGSGAQIGARCHVGAGAVVAGMMEPACIEPVIVEDDVLIGANAVILEGVKVGHHSIIGAGAVVTKDVAPYSVMVGVPARKIRENTKESLIESELR